MDTKNESNAMNLYRVAQTNEPVAKVFSLKDFVRNISAIKSAGWNVVSLRDRPGTSATRSDPTENQLLYRQIDTAGFANIYVAVFDDLTLEDDAPKGSIYPSMSEVGKILNWAKSTFEVNHKPFAVHCTGGISRSSAIAILIGKMLQNSYDNIFNPKYHSPNSTILDFGGEHLKEPTIKDEVRQKVLDYDKTNPFSF